MPLGGDGSSRAAGRTDLAGSVKKVETVRPVVRIFFRRGFERQIGNYTPHPHGFPLGSDKSIAQPKSAKPANIGGMALGPAGGKAYAGRSNPLPVRGVHRGHGLVTLFFQDLHQMIPQFYIKLFTEVPGMGPEAGGILGFLAVALTNTFRCRKDPRDHREFRRLLSFSESQLEDFPGGEVEFSDDLLVLFKERVVSGAKTHQRLIPEFPPADLTAVSRIFFDELGDDSGDKSFGILGKGNALRRFHGTPL